MKARATCPVLFAVLPRYVASIVSGVLCLLGLRAQGQPDSLSTIPGKVAAYTRQQRPEKLFLHLDQPCYVSGEVMWFKVYAVHGTTHQPVNRSKVAYVEILDDRHQPVVRGKVPLQRATGQGSFLLPESLPSGVYTVRAYTSWMKNADPGFYFHSAITVFNTFQPLGGSALRPEARYDAQFFPEGGNLVAGVSSKIGVKVVDQTGRGVTAEGIIRNEQGASVARFKTLQFGMGSFMFTPSSLNERYTATIQLPSHQSLTKTLPQATPTGYALRLEQINPTELLLAVQAVGAPTSVGQLTLLGHARGRPYVFLSATLINGQATFTLRQADMPEGITHFTVFNPEHKPVAERLYFRPPTQLLQINGQLNQPVYATRQKVSLRLTTVAGGQPAPANVSVAVYRLDSLAVTTRPTITSSLWLASDLKGTVEHPDYYLNNSAETAAAADNLMLTQGWSRFRWTDVLTGRAPARLFPTEDNSHLLRGQVRSKSDQSLVPGVTTYLSLPGRPVRLYVSRSAPDGTVEFEIPAHYGSKTAVLQTNFSTDSLYQLAVLNPFSTQYARQFWPAIAWHNGLRTELTQRHVQAQVRQAYFPALSNRYASMATDSLAFYGTPSESYLLDKYTRFKTMEEVLREYVPGVQVRQRKDGFHLMALDKVNGTVFAENPLVLLDGVPIFDMNQVMALDPLQIQKLEVVSNQYVLGPLVAKGLLSLTTYKGSMEGFQLPARALLQEYETLQWEREFYAPRYNTPQEQQSPLADLRQLLVWQPTVQTDTRGQAQIDFFTSDHLGRYQVEVQGLSATGQAGHSTFTFEVRQAL